MTTPRKHALLTASLVLVGASAMGCGSGGAPTDASEKDFCAGLDSFLADVGAAGESEKATIVAIKKWGDDMEEIGTPESISDDGRKGFEVLMKQVDQLDEGSTRKDLDEMDKDLSDSENDAIDAFDEYTTETCPSVSPEDAPAP